MMLDFSVDRPTTRILIIGLKTSLDTRVAEALKRACDKAFEDGVRKVVFDCSSVRHVDRTGLEALASLQMKGKGPARPVVILVGVSEDLRSKLRAAGLRDQFTFAEDREEAGRLLGATGEDRNPI